MMTQQTLTTGQLWRHVPMSRHTSWRVGGLADQCYQPAGLEDLRHFLSSLPPDEPLYFVGLGSNLLVRDGGVRGTVILMHDALCELRIEGQHIYAEAGLTCAKLARFAARAGLGGAEFLAGIPGTVGGALAMNAGCHGSETWDVTTHALTIDRQGVLHQHLRETLDIRYRHVTLPAQEWFVAAWLQLPPAPADIAEQKIRSLLAKRLVTQPLNLPNAGSVFRNPPGDFAARLIEVSGLKGYRIGDAQVSDKHANFIINLGSAKAAQIEALIQHVHDTVLNTQGVDLQPEVKIIGSLS